MIKPIDVFTRLSFFIVLFFIFYPNLSIAQYETLLHKPYGQNVDGIHSMYRDLININDSLKRAEKAQEIKKFALQNNDQTLALNVDFFLNFWNTFYQNQPKDVSLLKLKRQVEYYSHKDIDFLYERSLRALAEYYWKIEQNYELAFEQYLILDNRIELINSDDYPEKARDLMQIGEAYYYYQDYHLALSYFKKAIVIPETHFNSGVINSARNTMGLCYQELHQFDSAAACFNEILLSDFPEATAWKKIARGNIGANLYFQGDYDSAIPLIEDDLSSSIETNDFGSCAGAAIGLADIYLLKGNLSISKKYIDLARHYIFISGQKDRNKNLFSIMSKWCIVNGDKEMSLKYIDSTVLAIEEYNKKYSALNVLRAQQKIDLQNLKIQSSERERDVQRRIAIRNTLVLIVLILIITLILVYYVQKKKQLEKDAEIKNATHVIEKSKFQLNAFMEQILLKNRLIRDLESKIKHVDADNQNVLLELRQKTILTEDDWLQFKSLFEKVHSGYLYRLNEKYPEFSPAEIRFMSLAKLKFSNKEMAATLGVSSQSIRTNWYRIRKKLNLNDDISLDELVNDI
ncbi:MAG: hypothetical protein M9958_01015 [Chitinophagales bacterium]|nr:hypothetical protein [Chitinophagales bacterium]